MAEQQKAKVGGSTKKGRQSSHNAVKYARYRNENRREKNKKRRMEKLERKYKKNRERRENKLKVVGALSRG